MKNEELKTEELKQAAPLKPRDPLPPPSRPEASEPTLDERIAALQAHIDNVLKTEKRADHGAIFELCELKVLRSERDEKNEPTQEN